MNRALFRAQSAKAAGLDGDAVFALDCKVVEAAEATTGTLEEESGRTCQSGSIHCQVVVRLIFASGSDFVAAGTREVCVAGKEKEEGGATGA